MKALAGEDYLVELLSHAAKLKRSPIFISIIILENAVENRFTAKPLRTQRTYSKIKIHPFP
jgi:hypothetical protein